MRPVDRAREVKHRAYVVRKRAARSLRALKFRASTVAFRRAEAVRPFIYTPERYADTFLRREVPPSGTSAFPRHVFVIWAGDNAMSSNRARNIEVIEQRVGLPVELVTPANLEKWVVPGWPLHPSYEHLSLIHRSDYLRGYLMHHHGGAYIDVKEPLTSWAPSFDRMASDESAWVTSYRTTDANWIGKLRGRIGCDILVHYGLMFGKSGFMMRSQTPLTSAWMAQMDAVLDERGIALARHPGGVFGDDGAYPISWTDLLGRILDPLTLKFHEHVRYDDRLLLHFEGYR